MSKLTSFVQNKIALTALAASTVALFAFATPSVAEAGQFEVGGGFGYLGEFGKNDHSMHGINFRLFGGYKFLDWVGVYLNQDLGGDFDSEGDTHWSKFVGATIVSGDFFYPVGPVKISSTVGIGAAYTGKTTTRVDGHSETGGHSAGAFAFRVGAGCYYMVNDALGVGLTFDYTFAAFKTEDGDNRHFLNILAGVRYAF